MHIRRTLLAALPLALLLPLSACEQEAPTEPALLSAEASLAKGGDQAPASQFSTALQEVRRATARYHSVKQALADGFVSTVQCVSAADIPQVPDAWGAMGIHFVNPTRLQDGFNATEPEVLIYEPGPQGQLKLVGIEYLVNGAQPASFEGGVFTPGHVADWDLHVWLWRENPMGTFFPFNPNVTCEHAPSQQ